MEIHPPEVVIPTNTGSGVAYLVLNSGWGVLSSKSHSVTMFTFSQPNLPGSAVVQIKSGREKQYTAPGAFCRKDQVKRAGWMFLPGFTCLTGLQKDPCLEHWTWQLAREAAVEARELVFFSSGWSFSEELHLCQSRPLTWRWPQILLRYSKGFLFGCPE